jgi:MFS family permease
MSVAAEVGFAQRATRRLVVVITLVLCLASLATAYLTLNEFNRLLQPELGKKAHLIGRIVGADIQRAIDYGIPFEEFVEADAYLETVVADYDELAYIAIVRRDGALLYQGGTLDERLRESAERISAIHGAAAGAAKAEATGDTPAAPTELTDSLNYAFPVSNPDGLLGFVDIGIDKNFVQRQLDDIVYDIVVILIVALLVAFEVMLALILFYVTGPIQRLNVLMDLHSRGDFSKFLITRARDPVGRVTRHLSDGARQIHERYRNLSTHLGVAGEARGKTDRVAGPAALLQEIGTRFRLASAEGLTPLLRASAHDIRIPLFVFAFSEELQKSFLPLFVRTFYEPIPWLSEAVVIGLPIVAYLAVLAIAAPFSGAWSERYGSRRIFLIGLVPTVAGFIGCAVAGTIHELILWRGTTALGYAMVTIACQEYVIGVDASGSRVRSVSIFVGVIVSATMCGTAIGGILADRIGYRPVFVLAAALAIVAGFIAQRMLTRDKGEIHPVSEASPGRVERILVVLKNVRFVVFLLCSAIPANVLLAAFLWYLVPLYLFDLGARPAEIGRVMMVYYLLVIVAGPLASHLVDRFGGLTRLVALGSLLSGAGLVAVYDWRSIWAVVVAVGVMGIAHALIKAPQIALALQVCEHEIRTVGRTTVLNFLRSLERVGSMFGLLLSAFLVDLYGYQATIGIIGVTVCGSAVVFVLFYLTTRKRESERA